jgi:hypothetical protein
MREFSNNMLFPYHFAVGMQHYEAGGNTRCLCGLAENAVAMASLVVVSSFANMAPFTSQNIFSTTHHIESLDTCMEH